jgi:Reticulon
MSAPPRAPTFPNLDNDPVHVVESTFDDDAASPAYSYATPPTKKMSTAPAYSATSTPSMSRTPAAARRPSRLMAVLTWKDPKVSGVAAAACLAFFYLTWYKQISALSLAGASLAAFLSVGLLVVNLNGMAGGKLDHFIARPALSPPVFTTERAYALADIFVAEGNEFMDDARDVLYCDNTPLSVTWIVVGLAIYLLGKFSILPVLMVVTVAAFTLPIGYEKNKKLVDEKLAQASEFMGKHIETGRKVAGERAYQFKDLAAERSAPYLDKAPAVKNLAEKVGFTPSKKSM